MWSAPFIFQETQIFTVNLLNVISFQLTGWSKNSEVLRISDRIWTFKGASSKSLLVHFTQSAPFISRIAISKVTLSCNFVHNLGLKVKSSEARRLKNNYKFARGTSAKFPSLILRDQHRSFHENNESPSISEAWNEKTKISKVRGF